jgi:uncharacterized protein YcbK (DUF882 family)
LACHDAARTAYPHEWRGTRASALAAAFEAVRTAAGGLPITVLSGYRTPEHNRAIGGARHSQHVQGRALDLRPPAGWSVARFHALVLSLVESTNIRGVGRYARFVHIDVRPETRLARWSGTGVKDDRA